MTKRKSFKVALEEAIKSSKSASEFDSLFAGILDSLDGGDQWRTPSPAMLRIKELTGGELLVERCNYLKNHQAEFHKTILALRGLESWEYFAESWCEILVAAKALKLPNIAKRAASEIGEIIALQIYKNKFKAPSIVYKGLLNIQSGRPFKGKQPLPRLEAVFQAMLELLSRGISKPSQSEIMEEMGIDPKKGRAGVSKLIERLELRAETSDARRGESEARSRKLGRDKLPS